jgi:hypothetical protein
MPYRIAGVDVHKKMLAVVVADVEVDEEYRFERLKVGTSRSELRALADWRVERDVEEVVMESTAQYWRPVWEALKEKSPLLQPRHADVRERRHDRAEHSNRDQESGRIDCLPSCGRPKLEDSMTAAKTRLGIATALAMS